MRCGRSFAGLLLLAALPGVIWLMWDRMHPPATGAGPPGQEGRLPTARSETARDEPGERGRMLGEWRALRDWLETGPSGDRIRAKLMALRERWVAANALLLARMLQELLEEGGNVNLPMDFEVGAHGTLDGWPSLRVFLLDLLHASDPDQSRIIATRLLSETRSAEEYAVALRCLVRKGPGQASPGELQGYFSRMLAEPAWTHSAGLAEALDLARVMGTAAAARDLLAWPGEPALKRMAMEEFAAEHPVEMIDALATAESPDPATRASLMARIDPRDPEQLRAVDAYLRKPGLSPEESTAFLKMFPLRSSTTGNRLYGDRPAPYRQEEVAAGDRVALAQVNRWLADPALESQQPGLRALHDRLSGWVEQAR